MLRALLAPNPSPMTLDGTRTYLVGERRVAVIDPGPDLPEHRERILQAAGEATVVAVLLTHMHPDHAAGAGPLARRTGAPIRAFSPGTLADGERIATDAGDLVAIATPGHTPDHAAFHWPAAAAVFCGDLMMGGLDTALVASPSGDLGAYLASLARIRGLEPRVIHPAHGPAFDDPVAAIDTYVAHRARRESQVLAALAAGARAADDVVDRVYGRGLDPALRGAAKAAIAAYLEHLRAAGRWSGPDEGSAAAGGSGHGEEG
jgi:glyoxylase-like metal-dependent hydrolase (beta-lactamase superfamily II)